MSKSIREQIAEELEECGYQGEVYNDLENLSNSPKMEE